MSDEGTTQRETNAIRAHDELITRVVHLNRAQQQAHIARSS